MLPFNLLGQVLYYVGPAPAKPGQVIGSAGPTTSGRMDSYTPELLSRGLKGTIGKGYRSAEVIKAGIEYKAVYFAAVGGAGALIAKCIKKSSVIAYPELGPEAIYELEVEDFPLIVVNDIYGGDLYTEGRNRYSSNKICN
jgi:fumarate hydratase subunit beta